jgi:hypothetical protein
MPPQTVTDNPPAARSAASVTTTTGQPVLYGSGAPLRSSPLLVPATAAFKPGSGVIESVQLVHILPVGTAPSASAGAAGERLAYRLTIRMDDGSFQAVDVNNRNFMVGDRISLTGDGRVTRS